MRKLGIIAAAMLVAAPAAEARRIEFFGTQNNFSPPGAPGLRCAPRLTVLVGDGAGGIGTASGTSNLGDFEPVNSFCVAGPPPTATADGLFTWTFLTGDSISGTLTGSIGPSNTPGVLRALQDFTITGGSGRFRDATGAFTLDASVTVDASRNTTGVGEFEGFIDTPEPAATALIAFGWAGLGLLLRRRAPRG